jgi:hypothetical protein
MKLPKHVIDVDWRGILDIVAEDHRLVGSYLPEIDEIMELKSTWTRQMLRAAVNAYLDKHPEYDKRTVIIPWKGSK